MPLGDTKNVGDQRAGYPEAADMPELAGAPPVPSEEAPPIPKGGAPTEDNPVLQALRTLQEFVVAQTDKGNPKAESMRQHLMGFLTDMTGRGQELPPEEEASLPEEEASLPPEKEGVEIVSDKIPEKAIKEKKLPKVMS